MVGLGLVVVSWVYIFFRVIVEVYCIWVCGIKFRVIVEVYAPGVWNIMGIYWSFRGLDITCYTAGDSSEYCVSWRTVFMEVIGFYRVKFSSLLSVFF